MGCGDIGLRVARLLASRYRIIALTSQPGRAASLRAEGMRVIVGNLDERSATPQLVRLAAMAERVLYLAPPSSSGESDARLQRFISAMRLMRQETRLVYVSTTGVYGDHAGERIDETARLKPQTERALRRQDAELQLRALGAVAKGTRVTILRVPGIYDHDARSPRERLLKRTPALREADDVYTNHIHADDLARICAIALERGKPQRVINASNDSEMKMGDYFDIAADALKLPKPPRISRADAQQQLTAMQMSFMSESRRLSNVRLHKELRVKLKWPDVKRSFASLK